MAHTKTKQEPKTALEKVQDKQAPTKKSVETTKPRKRALKNEAKPATESKVVTKSKKAKASEPTPSPKASKKSARAEPAKTKRKSHAIVPDEAVLSALSDGKSLGKAEIVKACGGDAVAVTKTVLKLRGEGKVVTTGGTRSTLYRAA